LLKRKDQGRCRRQGSHDRRDRGGGRAERTLHGKEEHADRGHAHQGLGQKNAHELSPKVRTDRPMTMVESGGLSTVMKLDASKLAEEPGRPALRRGQRRRE